MDSIVLNNLTNRVVTAGEPHRGILSVTVLAIFFVPLFFVATLRLFRVKPKTLK